MTLEEEITLLEKKVALLKELKALEMQPVYVPVPIYPPAYPQYPAYPNWYDWHYDPSITTYGTITSGDIPSATSGSCSIKDFGGITYTAH